MQAHIPTFEDRNNRIFVIDGIRQALHGICHDLDILPFGSFVSGFYKKSRYLHDVTGGRAALSKSTACAWCCMVLRVRVRHAHHSDA